MDINPNLGGPFAYSENQENESVYTIPDDSLNPASRNGEELDEERVENKDKSESKKQQKE